MSHVRVAIVTGAGQGIGAGVARSFAEAGFTVSLMSPSDRSVKLASQLGGIGRQGSVLDPKDLAAVVEETRSASRTRSTIRTRRDTRRSTCTSSPSCAWLVR